MNTSPTPARHAPQPTPPASAASELLIRCFTYLGTEIQRLSLNESASTGVQKLSRDIAAFLDTPEPTPPAEPALQAEVERLNVQLKDASMRGMAVALEAYTKDVADLRQRAETAERERDALKIQLSGARLTAQDWVDEYKQADARIAALTALVAKLREALESSHAYFYGGYYECERDGDNMQDHFYVRMKRELDKMKAALAADAGTDTKEGNT